jgi:5-methylcytosine-specific restriction protein A
LRAAYLAENPLCEHCAAQGRVTAAAEVDHIKPFHAVEDPLRLDWSNLQSLCKTHHSQKTASEKGWGRGV